MEGFHLITVLQQESQLLQLEIIFLFLLIITTVVAIIIRFRRVVLPYTLALVLVGLGLSIVPETPRIEVTGELILALFVTPLVFEAALHIGWERFQQNLLPILLMAIPGVLISSFIVGSIVASRLHIPFETAVAFGALISATDPVAVIAFFRSLGVSRRLAILVEGESMLNDGIAIVVFTLAMGLTAGGGSSDFSLIDAVWEFLRVSGGGVIVGLILGSLVSLIMSRLDDHLIETTLTTTLAFGSFVLAEQLHVSGILAVVASGMYVGSVGLQSTSPTTKMTLDNFWEFLSFIANSIVFLLIGLEIDILDLVDLQNMALIGIAIGAVLLSRILVVYGLGGVSTLLGNRVSVRYRHVIFWGGLRGAVSLALALSISGPFANQIRLMTFGVVLFTLLIQGVSISSLINFLNLSGVVSEEEKQHVLAEWHTVRAGKRALSNLYRGGLIADTIWEVLSESTDSRLREILAQHPELEQRLVIESRREMLKAGRNALGDTLRRNEISEEVYEQELADIDRRLLVWDRIEGRLNRTTRGDSPEAEED